MEAFKRRSPNGANERTTVNVLSRNPVMAANLGLAEDVRYLIPAQIRFGQIGQLRLSRLRGDGSGSVAQPADVARGTGSHRMRASWTGFACVVQCVAAKRPAVAGGERSNHLFPAWPKDWDAQFTLAARDTFVITASQEKGQIEFVEIYSQKGGQCRVQNPWPGVDVTVYRNGKQAENISGGLLAISTAKGERVTLVPKGNALVEKKI